MSIVAIKKALDFRQEARARRWHNKCRGRLPNKKEAERAQALAVLA